MSRFELTVALLLLAVARVHRFSGLARTLGDGLERVSRRPVVAGLLLFAMSVGIAAGVALATGIPTPAVHDEFSYLLAADTFHEGRLANPTHPLWRHFETFQVIHAPSYASKYPPGMGLLLATGQSLGHPILGVWLGIGLAVVGVYWMLLGWVSRWWAFVGGLAMALHPYLQLYWGQGYWGGELPMLGGALVYGGLPRLIRRPTIGPSLLIATGAGLLAITRPFEGVVTCVPVLALLAWRMMTSGRLVDYAMRVVAPAALVLSGILGGLLAYNAAVTGHPLKMPYAIHHDRYEVSPLFLWEPRQAEPEYRHVELREFYTGWAVEWFDDQQTAAGVLALKGAKLRDIWWLLVGGTLTIPVLLGVLRGPRGWQRSFVLLAVGTACAANVVVPWLLPHYLAPVLPVVPLLAVWGLRRHCHDTGNRTSLPALVLVLLAAVLVHEGRMHVALEWSGRGRSAFTDHRERVIDELHQSPGGDFVFVEYTNRDEPRHREWVYNAADIDGSEIVWARTMSPEENRELMEYFSSRNVWRLHADEDPPRLEHVRSAAGID